MLESRIEKIKTILDTNKAEEIDFFDLREKDYFVDGVVIATTMGDRHALALLDFLKKGLKPEEEFLNIDDSGDWVVIDLGDLLIHLMTSAYREKYTLDTFLKEIGKSQEA